MGQGRAYYAFERSGNVLEIEFVDTGVWIGLAAAALALAAGIGFAGGKHVRTGRQHQPA